LSIALRHLGFVMGQPGSGDVARQVFEEALAVSRAGGWPREIAWNVSVLGRALALAGELEAAEELLQEGLVLGRRSGDMTAVMSSLLNLGLVYGKRGDFSRARQILAEAARLGQEIDVKFMAAAALVVLGDVCMADRDWDAAEHAYRTALEAATRGTTRGMMAPAGRRYAGLCQARGDHGRAVRLLSACAMISHAWDATIYFDLDPIAFDLDAIASEELMFATARTALGENEFAREVAAGQSLTLEQAILDAPVSDPMGFESESISASVPS